nr:MAG TPA: hypothetical protein [Caudoviricetes sp.]
MHKVCTQRARQKRYYNNVNKNKCLSALYRKFSHSCGWVRLPPAALPGG